MALLRNRGLSYRYIQRIWTRDEWNGESFYGAGARVPSKRCIQLNYQKLIDPTVVSFENQVKL